MAKTESPSINGFSITDLKMMQGMDGYIIRCTLNRDGRKVGEFFDGGDGSLYSFYPVTETSSNEIEAYLRKFPLIESDPELPPIHWNIGILVDRLIQKNDLKKALARAEKKNCNIIFTDDRQKGLGYILQCSKEAPDEIIRLEMERKYPEPRYTWKRYKNLNELNEVIQI